MTVEIIDDFNSKHNHETTKQTLFEQTPPVLIISMKRFIYDVEQNQTQKVVKHITITEDLCLPSVVMTNNQKVDYKLFAVVNHHGKKAQGGHYTVDVFCNDTEWYRFDDTDVGKIELDQVLKEESDRQPYLLFYTLKE
jgi:ubiquitin carboxyl-terminal hydrolase 10